MNIIRAALFAFGYPISIAVIARWIPVVREQRATWFVLHQCAVIAIVLGWTISGDAGAVAVNSAWLVAATVWYAVGSKRARALERPPEA